MRLATPPAFERGPSGSRWRCEEFGHRVEEMTPAFDPADVGATSGVLMGADLVVTVDDRLAAMGRGLRPDDVEPFTHVLLDHYRTLSGSDVLLTRTLAQPIPPLDLLDTTRPETLYEHGSTSSAWTNVSNVTGMPAP